MSRPRLIRGKRVGCSGRRRILCGGGAAGELGPPAALPSPPPRGLEDLAAHHPYLGHMTILRLLLSKMPPDIEAHGSGETALHTAVRDGNFELIPELVKQGDNVNASDFYGRTPLMWALMNGHTEAVKKLVGLGCNVNLGDQDGITPLVMGIRLGIEEIVDTLLEAGAQLTVAGHNTALHEAIARFASIGIMKKLVKKGDKYLDTPNDHGVTPLLLAITHSSTQAVELLLNANAEVNVEARILSFVLHSCTPLRHSLHQMLFPLTHRNLSLRVTKLQVRNQICIVRMLLFSGARWRGDPSCLKKLLRQIKTNLKQLFHCDDFSLGLCRQLDQVFVTLTNPRSLQDMCRLRLRSHYKSELTLLTKRAAFAPHFENYILAGHADADCSSALCSYISFHDF